MATTLATWTIEPVHASVEFSLDYMGLSTYRTGFRALEGSLEFDAAWPGASSVNTSIPVASVDVTNGPSTRSAARSPRPFGRRPPSTGATSG
jgi:polyisoprenoid-binding protein YceI